MTIPDRQKSEIKDTLERKKVSRDWLRQNFWGEWKEVWQQAKARVEPIINEATGKEDDTRTNIAMPLPWIIARRKTARLCSRPPSLRIRSKSEEVSNFLSGLAGFQWDRAEEQAQQRRHVLQASLFGFSPKLHWYDQVVISRRFRRRTRDMLAEIGVVMDDEQGALRVPRPEDVDAGAMRPLKDFNESQVEALLAQLGPEMFDRQEVKKYDGPVSSTIFLGDFYPSPEFESLHSSDWVIVDSQRDVDWIAHFAKQEYIDPRSGEKRKAFDPKAVQELLDMGSYSSTPEKDESLKRELRSALYKAEPLPNVKLLTNKKYLITAEYTFIDGWPHVRWIGNDKILLNEILSEDDPGAMPLPWDLYGHYPMSSLTPIPDLLWGIGDSAHRILRHLFKLHNITASQRTDLVTNALKPTVFVREGADLPAQIQDRGLFRVVYVKNPQDIMGNPLAVTIPREAWESEAQIIRMIQMGEPSAVDFGEQSQAVPGSQQVATIAALQNKVSESLSSDELEQLNLSLAEETKIKIWMWQQTASEVPEIPDRFFKEFSSEQAGGSSGSARVSIADPLDLQEDFEVFPEMGSTLALDDQLKVAQAEKLYLVASQDPVLWNKREAAKIYASTFRGYEPSTLLNPELPAEPKGPDTRLSISLSMKLEDFPGKVQEQILDKLGLPTGGELIARDNLKAVSRVAEAAKAAQELLEPIPEGEAPQPKPRKRK